VIPEGRERHRQQATEPLMLAAREQVKLETGPQANAPAPLTRQPAMFDLAPRNGYM
jgi:hypothetical protein